MTAECRRNVPGSSAELKWATTDWLSAQSASVSAVCCLTYMLLFRRKSVFMWCRMRPCAYQRSSMIWMSRIIVRIAEEWWFGAMFLISLQWPLPLMTENASLFFHCLAHSFISLTMNGRQWLCNYFMFKLLINSTDRDFLDSIALYHTFSVFFFYLNGEEKRKALQNMPYRLTYIGNIYCYCNWMYIILVLKA